MIVGKAVRRLTAVINETSVFLVHLFGLIPSHTIRKAIQQSAGIKIGKGSTIHMGAVFYDPKGIEIGDDTVIRENSVLDGRDRLKIGNHVALSSEVMIYNSQHDIHDSFFKAISKPVTIEDYVFIGPRAIILPGVTVGKGAVAAPRCYCYKRCGAVFGCGRSPCKEDRRPQPQGPFIQTWKTETI